MTGGSILGWWALRRISRGSWTVALYDTEDADSAAGELIRRREFATYAEAATAYAAWRGHPEAA